MKPTKPSPPLQPRLPNLPPYCPNCHLPARKSLTNRARLDNIPVEDLGKHPGCLITIWNGDWLCFKCQRVVATARNYP